MKNFNFEKSLQELESIVKTMEQNNQGELGLEESLKLFSRGVTLTKQCQESLKTAEQKVKTLVINDT